MTSLTGEFQTDLPLSDALVACTDAIDGLGWHIEDIEAIRIVSYADTGSEHPPRIDVMLAASERGTDIRITGSDTDDEPLSGDALIAELNRVRDAIKASVEEGVGAPPEGPPAGWYQDSRDNRKLRYWDGRDWTDQVRPRPRA